MGLHILRPLYPGRRWTTTLAVLTLMLLGVTPGCGIFRYTFDKSVDPASGSITLAGPSAEIIVRRDGLGVPFIEAQNESDLFFASGYVTAQDRLWQMISMSMVMQGRLAEIVGAEALPLDRFFRSLHARRYVDQAMARMDAQERARLEDYARGVNAYLATHGNLPAEFVLTGYRPSGWRPEDTLYVFGMLDLDVSMNFLEELDFLILAERLGYAKAAWLFPIYPDEALPFEEAAKLKEIPPGDLVTFKPGLADLRRQTRSLFPQPVPASNNWALAGRRTASGRPLLENDTHLLLMIPNAWMLLHLKCPTYEAAGVTIPGMPYVTLGYNGYVGWGATMVMADSQDIFLEKLQTVGAETRYLYKGAWLPVTRRPERFAIKGRPPVDVTFLETRHGPLLNSALETVPFPPTMPLQPLPMASEYGVALSWAVESPEQSLRSIYDLGKARDVSGARKAIQGLTAVYLNMVFADRQSIAWQVTGAYPLRGKGTGLLPSPGWTGEYDWNGWLNPESRPLVMDPAEGFIATANNRTVARDFPHQLTSSWYHPDRQARLAELLAQTNQADLHSTLELQAEQFSLMAQKLQSMLYSAPLHGRLTAVIDNWPEREKRARAMEALSDLAPGRFNAIMAADSVSAAVMGAFMFASTRAIFVDELGGPESVYWEAFLDVNMSSYPAPEDHLLFRPDSPFWDNILTSPTEAREDTLAEALNGAIELLEERLGRDRRQWQWGKLHTYHWKHEFTNATPFFHDYFNRGPYPAGGDSHSLNVGTFTWGDNFEVWNIPAMRMIVDFGREEPMSLITVPGQSGNPSSGHYGDMVPAFLNVEGRPMPFGTQNIEKQYREEWHLVPEADGRAGRPNVERPISRPRAAALAAPTFAISKFLLSCS
jgi:acyl-homoserine-lactone acylase